MQAPEKCKQTYIEKLGQCLLYLYICLILLNKIKNQLRRNAKNHDPNNGGIQLAYKKRNNMMAAIENNLNNNGLPLKQIGWSILIGVGGNMLIFLFLMTFMHIFAAVKFIPWIIAFNTAVSGYSLIDKTRNRIKRKKLSAALMGAIIAIITCGLLVILSIFVVSENFLTLPDFVFFLIIGVIGSTFGALLGIKYFRLK